MNHYVQIIGPAGRITYMRELGTGNYDEVEDRRLATVFHDEYVAADAAELVAENTSHQKILITVRSEDEFES